MLIREISKEELLKYLFNDNPIGKGDFGVVSEYDDNTLIKIYYNVIKRTYANKDGSLLEQEIEMQKNLLKSAIGCFEMRTPIEKKEMSC